MAIKNGGQYKLYNIQQNPTLRNTDGSCDLSQISNSEGKPNFFVFPYDFRKSNALSAEKLKQFIQCIQEFYPDNKVDILGHSQGGIVARRYVLDSVRAGYDHKVDKVITIASPFLGAPEALYKLETGGDYLPDGLSGGLIDQLGFSVALITPPTLKRLAEFFPSAHQLLPTRDYNNLSGESLREFGDMNDDGIPDQSYTYEQTKTFINNDFSRSLPGNTEADFHDCITSPMACGQDNWQGDQSGVKYFHIVATKAGETTTTSVNVKYDEVCNSSSETGEPDICVSIRNFSPVKGTGDGTVPRISGGRGYLNESNSGLNAENAVVKYLDSPSTSVNANYEHNGVTKNPETHAQILSWLGGPSSNSLLGYVAPKTDLSDGNKIKSQSVSLVSDVESYYIKLLGVSDIQISDGNGNKTVGNGEYLVNPVNGLLEYKVIGQDSFFLTFESTDTHFVDFQVGNQPLMLEALKGINNQTPNLAVRFKDISLPSGVGVRLTLNYQGVESLRYDSDANGSFDTLVNPTVILNGINANDTEPPTATIAFTQQGTNVTLSLAGQDSTSGIARIKYSLDGSHFTEYVSPLTLTYTPNLIRIYAFVDDNAGNRSGLYTKEFSFFDIIPPTTVATQTPNLNSLGWNNTNVGVTLSANDNFDGVGVREIKYNVNGSTISVPDNFANFTITAEGTTSISFYSNDNVGNIETTKNLTIKIDKTPPLSSNGYELNGTQASVTLNATDVLSGIKTISYSIDGGITHTYDVPFTISGSGNHIVTYFATDNAGNVEGAKNLSFTIPIVNVNPNVIISSPANSSVYPIGTTVNFAGSFSNDQCNTHSAIWRFDTISQVGTINETERKVNTTYSFSTAGVYLVSLTINNSCGGNGQTNTINGLTAMVVVYDPEGGFVTGGGWINSPLGAYTPNPSLMGRASFGFTSKYQRGATVPTGNTEFQFRVADFNFKSTNYDWLVVGGAKAQYKGSGTINDSGNFGFMLTAIDGQVNGGGGTDKFRIKVWNKSSGVIIYDNQLSTPDGSDPTTVIGGGSIIIHKR
jgi:hypothetical protein